MRLDVIEAVVYYLEKTSLRIRHQIKTLATELIQCVMMFYYIRD